MPMEMDIDMNMDMDMDTEGQEQDNDQCIRRYSLSEDFMDRMRRSSGHVFSPSTSTGIYSNINIPYNEGETVLQEEGRDTHRDMHIQKDIHPSSLSLTDFQRTSETMISSSVREEPSPGSNATGNSTTL